MFELFDSFFGRTHIAHICAYLVTFCSRPKSESDVISSTFVRLIVRDKHVKLRDPSLNCSLEIQLEAI